MLTTYPVGDHNMFDDFREGLSRVVDGRKGLVVCDIGGGAHPFFSPEEINTAGFRYTVLDISPGELALAPGTHRKIVCDAGGDLEHAVELHGARVNVCRQFDLVFSVMTAEHIRDAESFHRNVLAMLVPGGSALHLFPTLYTIPFLINKYTPEFVARFINRLFAPAHRRTREKFRAYYHWCRGPLRRTVKRFERTGAEMIEYCGYFAHGYYRRFPPLHWLHQCKMGYLERHPMPLMTNYAFIWYRKPQS